MMPEQWQEAEACLREGWSPEQVAGRFRLEGEEMAIHEWICRHVRRDREAAGIPAGITFRGGHCRASGGGVEEPHRRLGAGHDHRRKAPGSPALPGGPDVEVHDPGTPGQQGLGARD